MSESIREALVEAFDKVEQKPEEKPEEKPEQKVEEKPEPKVEEKPEEKPELKAEEKPEQKVEEKPEPKAEEKPEQKPEQKVESEYKPPQSWKPAVREHWSKLPAEVQAEVTRRELEISRALNHSAGARKIAEQFYQAVQPYEGLIRSANSTPLQMVDNLMRTAARLRLGSPLEKAQATAEVIRSFGIDIKTLDEVLAGSPELSEQGRIDALVRQQVEQRLAPFNQQQQALSAAQQADIAAKTQQAEQEMETFASSHDYFEDVRLEMADFIDIAKSRGVDLSLQDAYDRAINVRPDLKKLIDQKAAAKNAEAVAKAKLAASSISSRSTPVKVTEPETIRGAVEQAWDRHAR